MSNTDTTEAVSYEKGTWQDTLNKSGILFDRSAQGRKRASALLWTGAQAAVEDWLPGADTDVSGETLYNEVLDVLGKSRKGDASKIKTVAVAVRAHGLVLSTFPNLSKAYAEAVRLTKTQKAEADEDDAAEKAVEALAESVPNSTTTPEGAALILLSKGIDGAVVAILDALNGPSGANNEAAHRSFMRAVSTEIAARVQAAKPKPAPKAPAQAKKGATKAGASASPKAEVKDGKAKAKPVAKAKPTSASKGDPNKKALPPKAKPVTKAKPAQPAEDSAAAEPVHAEDVQPVSTPKVPVKKAAPVVRR